MDGSISQTDLRGDDVTHAEWLHADHKVIVAVQADLERLMGRAAGLRDETEPSGFWTQLEEILSGFEDLVGGLLLRLYAAADHGDAEEVHAQLVTVKHRLTTWVASLVRQAGPFHSELGAFSRRRKALFRVLDISPEGASIVRPQISEATEYIARLVKLYRGNLFTARRRLAAQWRRQQRTEVSLHAGLLSDMETERESAWRGLNTLGYPDNIPVLMALLEARHTRAQARGFSDASAEACAALSIQTPERARDVLRHARRWLERAEARREETLSPLLISSGGPLVEAPWDRRWNDEKIRRALLPASNALETTVDAVLDVLLEFAAEALCWSVERIGGAQTPWARGYGLTAPCGQRGTIWFDINVRTGKRDGLRMVPLRTGLMRTREASALIQGSLLPERLSDEGLEGLCHELGHALHHILNVSEHSIILSGVPRAREHAEFVALMVESWAYRPSLLDRLGLSAMEIKGRRLLGDYRRAQWLAQHVGQGMLSLALHTGAPEHVELDRAEARIRASVGEWLGVHQATRFEQLATQGVLCLGYLNAQLAVMTFLGRDGGESLPWSALLPRICRPSYSRTLRARITGMLDGPEIDAALARWLGFCG